MTQRRFGNYSQRARLGLIVPPTNTVNEAEWMRLLPEGVTLHVTRMPLHADSSSEGGRAALYADIRSHVLSLAQAAPDVIAYGCTAGSMVNPINTLTDYMQQCCGVPAVATAPALVQAVQALGLQRVALATPYHDALNAHEQHFLEDNGIAVLGMRGLGIGAGGAAEYIRIAQVPLQQVYNHVLAADVAGADAILISCTDFASLPLLSGLEQALGKPVISSNQATLWAALRCAGISDAIPDAGRLLQIA